MSKKSYEISLLLKDEEGLYGFHLDRLVTVLSDFGKVKLLNRKQNPFPDGTCCTVSMIVKIKFTADTIDDLLLAISGLKYVRLAKSDMLIEKVLDVVPLYIKSEGNEVTGINFEKYEKLGTKARLLLEKKLTPLTLERLYNIESEMINLVLKYDELTIAVFD